MTVATPELCKQLFDLSGWSDTYFSTNIYNGRLVKRFPKHSTEHIPAYDLGFLLRKLPPKYYVTRAEAPADNIWCIGHEEELPAESFSEVPIFADTPEDAACMLAIELFKQGILTK